MLSGLISVVLMILMGLLTTSDFLKEKIPQIGALTDALEPYKSWIGVTGVLWAIVALLFWLIGIAAVLTAPLMSLIGLASILIMLVLGLHLGWQLLQPRIPVQQVGDGVDKINAAAAPHLTNIGLASLGLGILYLLLILFAGRGYSTPAELADCEEIDRGSYVEYICPKDTLDMAEGLEKRGTEIVDPTRSAAYIRTLDEEWISVDLKNGVAFSGRTRVGQWKDGEFWDDAFYKGKIIDDGFEDSLKDGFTTERGSLGLEIHLPDEMIAVVQDNGVILKDGKVWGQAANIDPYRPSDMTKLLAMAFLYTDLFE